MKKLFFCSAIVALATLLFSCSKDDRYPQTFVKDSFVIGEVKMFTAAGEVTDKAKIARFVKSSGNCVVGSGMIENQIPPFIQEEQMYKDASYEIVFHSDTKGEVVTRNDDGKTFAHPFELLARNGYSIINMKDTVGQMNDLTIKVPKLLCTPVVISREVSGTKEFITCYYPIFVKTYPDRIEVVVMSYMESTCPAGSNSRIVNLYLGSNNLFNREYLEYVKQPNLYKNDTIAFKESSIVFRRK